MRKIGLIIQREYLTRVKKKSFIVTTLLLPIAIFVVIVGVVLAINLSNKTQKILVWDETNFYTNQLDTSSSSYVFLYTNNATKQSDSSLLATSKADLLVHVFPAIPNRPDSVLLFKEGGVSLVVKEFISGTMNEVLQQHQMRLAGINATQLDSIRDMSVQIRSFDVDKKQETDAEITSGIAYFMGFLIYMVIFIYGSGVMRGVMEEKTNRIAEVIISSVKPFELMMGKIIGIALVGLTQLALWVVLMLVLQTVASLFIPEMGALMQAAQGGSMAVTGGGTPEISADKLQMMTGLVNQPWGLIIFCFFFYFLGGYFLYASMFAAVGSLVNEDPQEAQQFTLPVTIPIIIGFIIMSSSASNPDSMASVVGSIVPFTSPIVMLSRIPFGVPTWQLILSMTLLVGMFLVMTWLSAKIYRTGILMYGKKITWKELLKWLRYR
jgi:ABC-2 type transport system permease protein